ncbi:hypothetical protein BXY66_3447 [Shimia isoporae]|uniref:DUF2955 family protein n=1 Tax=Shimia isoporae TaxID=647720 RepID=A0A4R1N2W2_9RHOB|nr:hypothetical protein [Shimia isoporae]TCK99743.1 hypothetical protein BXY66_3447 [Shimia isoporae]
MTDDQDTQVGFHRMALRLTLGVGGAFLISQIWPWPLSYVMPVFVALLLQEKHPMTYRAGIGAVGLAWLLMAIGYGMAVILTPFPVLFLAAATFLLWSLYMFMLTSGAPMLAVVGGIIGALVIPVLVPNLPDVARSVTIGLMFNTLVALLITQVAFLLVPPLPNTPTEAKPLPSREMAASMASKLVVAIGPIMAVFLLFGLTDILLLSVAAMIALSMGAKGGWSMGMGLVIANLAYGGVVMLLFYEATVIAPVLPLFLATSFFVVWIFASRIAQGTAKSAMWSSALTGFLILSGSIMLATDVDAGQKFATRVGQLLAAALYVALAFQTVDLLSSVLKSRSNREAP